MPERLRECGSCTACCKTHPVRELDKPSGAWCKHCDRGKGCRIYSERPFGCRDFKCQWLLGSWAEDQRPNKVHIVADLLQLAVVGETYALFESHARGLDGIFAKAAFRWAWASGFTVLVVPLVGTPKLYVRNKAALADNRFGLEDGRIVEVVERL